MKKEYKKPEILFENFALSTSIAAECEVIVAATRGTCGYPIRGETVFMSTETGCSTGPQTTDGSGDGAAHDSICYHTFKGNNVFNS